MNVFFISTLCLIDNPCEIVSVRSSTLYVYSEYRVSKEDISVWILAGHPVVKLTTTYERSHSRFPEQCYDAAEEWIL